MNSLATQFPSGVTVKFCALGGALAGYLFASGVCLLQPLVGMFRSLLEQENTWDLSEVLLRSTSTTLLLLTGAGLGVGVLWGVLLPHLTPGMKRLGRQLLYAAWVLFSFVWSLCGIAPICLDLSLGLLEAMLTLVVTVAFYRLWRLLLRWIHQGYIHRTVMVIVATGLALWIPFGAYLLQP